MSKQKWTILGALQVALFACLFVAVTQKTLLWFIATGVVALIMACLASWFIWSELKRLSGIQDESSAPPTMQ